MPLEFTWKISIQGKRLAICICKSDAKLMWNANDAPALQLPKT